MQITFFAKFRFWVNNLGVRYYKNQMNKIMDK